MTDATPNGKHPKVFISNAWEFDADKRWTKDFAKQLRASGIDAILDQWAAVPGDSLPQFIANAIRESDYVLLVCTPEYKQRSDAFLGGVGFEGRLMAGEILTTSARRKFIPLLRRGSWSEAGPAWIADAFYLNFTASDPRAWEMEELVRTLRGEREQAPPVSTSAVVAVDHFERTPLQSNTMTAREQPPASDGPYWYGKTVYLPRQLHEDQDALEEHLAWLKSRDDELEPPHEPVREVEATVHCGH